MNIWTLLLVAVGLVQAAGLVVLLVGLLKAPKGHQTADGFQYGEDDAPVLRVRTELLDFEPSRPPFGHAA